MALGAKRGRPVWLIVVAMLLTSVTWVAQLIDGGGVFPAAMLTVCLLVLIWAVLNPSRDRT